MDINLKIDKELDNFFSEVDNATLPQPQPVVVVPAQETAAPEKTAEPEKADEPVNQTKPEETSK